MTGDRWEELEAGTLVPPAAVQWDDCGGGKHKVWLYMQDGVRGPFTAKGWGPSVEAALIARASRPQADSDGFSFTVEDGEIIE